MPVATHSNVIRTMSTLFRGVCRNANQRLKSELKNLATELHIDTHRFMALT